MSTFGTTTCTRARPRVILWPDRKRTGRIDLSRWVTAIDFSKQLGQPTGSWSVNLAASQGSSNVANLALPAELERVVHPNSLVTIGMDEPGGIVMGLVDDGPRTVVNYAGGQGKRELQITGSDMGKLLAQDHIVHASLTVEQTPEYIAKITAICGPDNALIGSLPGAWGPINPLTKAPTFLAARIDDVAAWMLGASASVNVPSLAALGGIGAMKEFVRRDITTWNDARLFSEAPKDYNGTLWGFLQSIIDTDFYESIIDSLVPPTLQELPEVRLTIRPKPYDSRAVNNVPGLGVPTTEWAGTTWEELRTRIDGEQHWTIPQHEVLRMDLSRTDADVMSYYHVTADHELLGNPQAEAEGLYYPATDLFALQRAGLRAYQGRLSLVAGDFADTEARQNTTETGSAVVEFRNRLLNWYRLAEYYEAGSITVTGRDRYRVGDPVYLPWHWPRRGFRPGVRFYVVGTSHKWQRGGHYTTTLRLVRGHNSSVLDTARADIALAGVSAGVPGMVALT